MSVEIPSEIIRVLYVDDEEHNLVSFKATFRQQYDVQTAISGSVGLELLENHQFDVIISDQRMPNMTGVDFLQKAKEVSPDSIRVILTGYSDIESVVASINRVGVFRYIGKPWEEHDLAMTIDSAAEKLRLTRENRALVERLSLYNQELEQRVAQRTEQLQRKSNELERVNSDLSDMNSRLLELNSEKTNFLELAANDIKKPISTIIKNLQKLISNFSSHSPAQAQMEIEAIESIAKRIQGSITNLIGLNDSESNPRVDPTIFDMSMILQIIDMNYRKSALEKNIAIKFERDHSVKMIRSDPQHVQTILDQLVSNAVKFAPLGSVVTTIVSQSGDILRCEVRDEGSGILEEEKHLVFRRYAKLSSKPSGGESTTGLGLALVKNLVSAIHGKVWFENRSPGVSFIVELPSLS